MGQFSSNISQVRMWSVETLLCLTLLQATVHSVSGLDMYQDAVDKYAKWIKKYGSQRSQRNTNLDLSNILFVPHRPKSVKSAVKAPQLSLSSLREFEEELLSPDTVRNVRNNEIENSYGFSLKGLPPHKQRKSFPYYGRKRRDVRGERPLRGWTILDPNTGRPIDGVGLEANLRSVRKPQAPSFPLAEDTGSSYSEFRDENGQVQPIYKYFKKYPHGYSG